MNDPKLHLATSGSGVEPSPNADALTGLRSRTWFDEALPRQVERCERLGEPLSLVLADIDGFGKIGAALGPRAADTALRHVADILAAKLRPGDMLARYAGDRLALLLPATDGATATRVAERLRTALGTAAAPPGAALPPMTLSLGVSELAPGDSLEHFLHIAESALLDAKRAGRNCVRFN